MPLALAENRIESLHEEASNAEKDDGVAKAQ